MAILPKNGGKNMNNKKSGCPTGFSLEKNGICYKKVTSVNDLIKLCNKGFKEYVLFLQGSLKSSKIIHYTPEVRKRPFDVWNLIDDSEERMSIADLKESHIGKGIKQNAFYCEETPR